MLTTILLSTALAAPPVPTAQAALAQPAPPHLMASCQPIGGLIDVVNSLPFYQQISKSSRPSPQATDAQMARYVWSLMDPGGIEAAGLSREGAVTIEAWLSDAQRGRPTPQSVRLSLPFTGDQTHLSRLTDAMRQPSSDLPKGKKGKALAAAAREAEEATLKTLMAGDSGEASIISGGTTYALKRDARTLQIQTGPAPKATSQTGLRMLEGLPEGPACLLYAHLPEEIFPKAKVPVQGSVAFLPMGPSEAHLRVLSTLKTPELLKGGAQVPVLATTRQTPKATVVISADLLQLSEQIMAALPLPVPKNTNFDPASFKADEIPIAVPAGTQVAAFASPKRTIFAAAVPVTSKHWWISTKSRRLIKRVAKALKKQGIAAQSHADGGLSIQAGKWAIRIHARNDVLLIGTYEAPNGDATAQQTLDALISDIVTGQGSPWLNSKMQYKAEQYPIVLQMQMGPRGPVADVGLRADAGLWDAAVGMTMGEQAASGVTVFTTLSAIGIPKFVQMQYKAKHGEVLANIGAIQTALLIYEANFDTYIPIPAHPRTLETLNGDAVPWTKGSGFDTLGWAPDGHVRGTYWVEVAEDGTDFTIWGAIDLDANGEAALFKATKTTPPTKVTRENTY